MGVTAVFAFPPSILTTAGGLLDAFLAGDVGSGGFNPAGTLRETPP